ncbi:MAG: NosD domain-containing protein [Thermodesulfobacteriota bacterium]|nr:NosD domain-containing protein [Thermodesulfobacteriota bacterium]
MMRRGIFTVVLIGLMLCIFATSVSALSDNKQIIDYHNSGPKSSPMNLIIPGDTKVISATAEIEAHSGGDAPYSLTAITFKIDDHATCPNTHRIAPSQIRGDGTLRAWNEGETKEFTIDLSSVMTPKTDPDSKGSFQFDYLPYLTSGTHTIDCYTSVGTESWTDVKMVLYFEDEIKQPIQEPTDGFAIYVDDDFTDDDPINHKWNTIKEGIDDAVGGDTIIVKPGTYREHLVIDKQVTLKGERYPVVDGEGTGTVIWIRADEVHIEGFKVIRCDPARENSEKGIKVRANECVVNNCIISGNNIGLSTHGRGNLISNCKFNDNRIGLVVSGGGERNTVKNNHLTECGLTLDNAKNNLITGNIIELDPTPGISIYNKADNNVFVNNTIRSNSMVAFEIVGSEWGPTSHGNKIYHNNIVDNGWDCQVYDDGNNQWDNGAEGNYWGDYEGEDADGDGIGDMPYDKIGDGKTGAKSGAKDNYPLMEQWYEEQSSGSPIPSLTLSPSQPEIGDVVTLDASSSYDPDGGNIKRYTWLIAPTVDFNGEVNEDESYEVDRTGVSAINFWARKTGIYIIRLTVEDDEGQTADVTEQITVEPLDGYEGPQYIKGTVINVQERTVEPYDLTAIIRFNLYSKSEISYSTYTGVTDAAKISQVFRGSDFEDFVLEEIAGSFVTEYLKIPAHITIPFTLLHLVVWLGEGDVIDITSVESGESYEEFFSIKSGSSSVSSIPNLQGTLTYPEFQSYFLDDKLKDKLSSGDFIIDWKDIKPDIALSDGGLPSEYMDGRYEKELFDGVQFKYEPSIGKTTPSKSGISVYYPEDHQGYRYKAHAISVNNFLRNNGYNSELRLYDGIGTDPCAEWSPKITVGFSFDCGGGWHNDIVHETSEFKIIQHHTEGRGRLPPNDMISIIPVKDIRESNAMENGIQYFINNFDEIFDHQIEDIQSTTPEEKSVPGFGAIFAIAGLLVVAYLLKKRQ